MSTETDLYGIEKLTAIPSAMKPWQDGGMTLVLAQPTEFGDYVLVGCEPSRTPYQHEIGVIDEKGNPLSGIQIVVAWPSDDPRDKIGKPWGKSYWDHGETDLRGVTHWTKADGWAMHPPQHGGERIWVWDIEQATGDLKLACVKVEYCPIVNTAQYSNTGVRLTFQRRRVTTYRVKGTVKSRAGANVAGLRVVIVDKTAAGDVTLVETSTQAGGVYQASFTDEGLRLRGRTQPDVQARVFAGAKLAGFSAVRYHATTSETLDVLLNDGIPDDAGRQEILRGIVDVSARQDQERALAQQLVEDLRAAQHDLNQDEARIEGREQYLAQLSRDILNAAGNEAEKKRLEAWRDELTKYFQEQEVQIAGKRAGLDELFTRARPIELRLAALRERQDEQYAALLGEFSTEMPIVLLPVRLETRFKTVGTRTDLLIRVYPDAIHIDAHLQGLADAEVTWGQHFWQQINDAAATDATRETAWRQVAERFGAGRAAWIAEATRPGNTPPRRSDDQWFPPHARALPDYWLALGYLDGQRVLMASGKNIADPLVVGPTAKTKAPGTAPGLAATEDMYWMLDFDAALAAGMALRVPLTTDPQRGLDRLIVVGVKATWSGAQSAAHLAELLTAHRYTRGLAFVPQGTPTNNTGDAPSGFDSRAVPPAMAPHAPAMTLAADADGARTAEALRLPAPFFTRTPHADGQEHAEAGAMNTALWPATWGYYLEQFMGGALSAPVIEQQRRHFARYVRGRGPLPALRVGEQPYGLLPATALDRWSAAANAGATMGVAGLLRNLRNTWRRSAGQVSRVQQNGDLDHNLAEVLALDAISHAYTVRPLFGGDFATNLAALLNNPQLRARWTAEGGRVRELLLGFGLKQPSRLARAAFVFQPYPFGQALVQPDEDPSHPTTASNYIQRLRKADYQGILVDRGRAEPLLYLLLRHAALLAYDAAAGRLARQYGLAVDGEEREAELVDFDTTTSTPWRRLERDIPALPGMTAGAYLDLIKQDQKKVVPAAEEATVAFLEFWESLRRLASRPADALERAMAETLDLSSHRLDAWITSFATERLASLRRNEIAIGGYGWLEDVRPGDAAGSRGFVQAPSLAQAATAAVLRNGYLAHGGVTDANPLAVNLSSARVRLATWFLEGARQGQSLGALLGYRFERGLHERPLDKYIRPFRLIAPVVALTNSQETNDRIQAWVIAAKEHVNAVAEVATQQAVVDDLYRQRDDTSNRLAAAQADLARSYGRTAKLPDEIVNKTAEAAGKHESLIKAETELRGLEVPTVTWEKNPQGHPVRVVDDPSKTRRAELVQLIIEYREDYALLYADVQTLSAELKGLETILPILPEKVATLRTEYKAREVAATYASTILKSKEENRDRLKDDEEEKWNLLSPEVQTRIAFEKTVADLTREKVRITGERDEIEVALAAKKEELEAAEDHQQRQEHNLNGLRNELPNAQGAIDRADKLLNELLERRADSGTQYELQGDKVVVIKPSGSSILAIEEDISNVRKALRSAEDTKAQLDIRIANLVSDLVLTEVIIANLSTEISGLESQKTAKENELEQVRVDLVAPSDALMRGKFPSGEALEAIPAHDVVDGWELLQRWQAGLAKGEWSEETIPFGHLDLPEPKPEVHDFVLLRAELAALADAADAVSDLVTAESVYQMVQGNTMRAGATLNAVASGETLPEYEVIRTPRSGVALTHRLAMLWSGPAPAAPTWSPRAQAEPRLNQWAGQVLGDFSQVIFSARAVKQGTDEEVIPTTHLHLGQLGMAPLDLIYAGEGSDEVKQAEIEQRAVYYLLKQHASVTDPLDIYLDFDASRPALEAIFEASRAIHALLAAARPADGQALTSSGDPVEAAGIDLQQRARNAITELEKAFQALPKEKEPDGTTSAETLGEHLLRLASFGVPGAVPAAPPGDAGEMRRALWLQAWGCRSEVERRLNQAQAIKPTTRADTLSQLEAVFGRQFRVMPAFGSVSKLPEALGTTAQQVENGREVVRWFQRIARVRDGAARLDAALMAAEAMNPATPLDLRVFQFPPPAPTEKWGALAPPAGGRLSVVAQVSPGFAPAGPLAGLIVDDWVEVVPGETETSGVAFHFDAPGSQAPQVILLAVPPAPPEQRPKWDMDTLADIVLETLELARLRTVTQESLGEIGHLLPASYFALNAANDTVSTDFAGFEN